MSVPQKESLFPPVTQVRDPRTRSATWSKLDSVELVVPRFKVRSAVCEHM